MTLFRGTSRLFVKGLLSILFFAILLSFIKTNDLLTVFSRVDWLYLVLCLTLTPVMVLASCLKWKLILDRSGRAVPLTRLLHLYLVGYFFSNVLPSTVGGDVARSYYAGRDIDNQAYSAVAVFLERFTGLMLLLLLAVVMPLSQPAYYGLPFIYLPAMLAASILVILVLVAFVPGREQILATGGRLLHRLTRMAVSWLPETMAGPAAAWLDRVVTLLISKLAKVQKEMGNAIVEIRKKKTFMVLLVVLTAVFYLLAMINVYLAYRAFQVEVPFVVVCALVPTALFAAQVPVSLLGNLGYFESVFVGYFLIAGVPGAESLAMGLLLRLKMLVLGAVGLVGYLRLQGREVHAGLDSLSANHKSRGK